MTDRVQWDYVQFMGEGSIESVDVSEATAKRMLQLGFDVSKGMLGQHRVRSIQLLNYLGGLGWELVTSHSDGATGIKVRCTYVMKRQRVGPGLQDTVDY